MAETGLPLPATRLFGRDDELRLVADLLQDSRLVTLTGAGGCGKTRLALTVASQRADQYDGICWVDLASLTDPALVPKAVGSALHLADRPGAEPVDWLINATRRRSSPPVRTARARSRTPRSRPARGRAHRAWPAVTRRAS
ncbi:MAG: hypothetical protein JJD92_00160 [Frankiaceae bacterium]|nr:hypothetical protein [Frankiaceae bacterium]